MRHPGFHDVSWLAQVAVLHDTRWSTAVPRVESLFGCSRIPTLMIRSGCPGHAPGWDEGKSEGPVPPSLGTPEVTEVRRRVYAYLGD